VPVIVVVIALGVLLGGWWGREPFGAIAGGLLAWLSLRSVRQAQAIAELRQALAGRPEAVPVAVAAPAPAAAVPRDAAVETEVEGRVTAEIAARIAPEPAAAAPPAFEAATVEAAAAAPTRPGLLARARAWLVGGNTIAKAGVGILFVGLAFLAKYTAEHAQLPIELRLAGIAAVALVLLGLGWRLRGARPAYAQALQGGAVAVLYLTLFAAFRGYGVLAAAPVFALMVAVAALAAALAVLQDARALAVIGAVGGYATPLLVSTGSSNAVALFSYYLVLDLGVAAVAWFRNWRLLHALAFAFTFGVGGSWGVFSYAPDQYASSQAFLIAYFLLFNAVLFMPARHADQGMGGGERWVNGGLLFGVPTVAFVLQHGLVRHLPYGTAFSALVLAAFYVALAARLRRQPRLALSFDATLAIATVFLSLVVPFALDDRGTAGAWALEGAGLLWLGLRQQRRLPRAFGYALLTLAGGAWLLARALHAAPTAWFNGLALNGLLVAAAALAAGCFVQRARREVLMRHEAAAEGVLIAFALAFALLVLQLQIESFVPVALQASAWLAGLSVLALACAGLSLRLRWPALALPTVAHAPWMALFAAADAASLHAPWADGGLWAWPLALATQLLLLRHAAAAWPPTLRSLAHALGALVLAALGALAGRTLTAGWGDAGSAWPWLGWLAAPAMLLALLPRPATARRWPVRAAPAAYQQGVGAVLAVGLLMWTLLANLASDGGARPLQYVPMLNPLDLGVAMALFAAAQWWRSAPVSAALQHRPRLMPALLGACAFVWLNAMLVRGFHHYGGVPYAYDSWVHSLAVQTGLTLLWSTTASVLMWLSARRGLRAPWVAGAALLAVVVLKLLLVDLSGSGSVTRIVSFIGVGALMLVIAYVAPLPAGEVKHETT
jgi:uncharacterized membrane protein